MKKKAPADSSPQKSTKKAKKLQPGIFQVQSDKAISPQKNKEMKKRAPAQKSTKKTEKLQLGPTLDDKASWDDLGDVDSPPCDVGYAHCPHHPDGAGSLPCDTPEEYNRANNIPNSGESLAPPWAKQLMVSMKDFSRSVKELASQVGRLSAVIGQQASKVGELEAQTGLMTDAVRQMNAWIVAGDARSYNSKYCINTSKKKLVPVVKLIPGHPTPQPPPFFSFVLPQDGVFRVGHAPPVGLVPNSLAAIEAFETHAPLNAIYWFYNEPSLVEGQSLATRLSNLRAFLLI